MGNCLLCKGRRKQPLLSDSGGVSQERLGCLQSLLTKVLLRVAPLVPLGEQGISQEERLRRLGAIRSTLESFAGPQQLQKELGGIWTQEELLLPRRCGRGEPVRVLIGKPAGVTSVRGLPLVVWAHGGGLSMATMNSPELVKALKGAAQLWKSQSHTRAPLPKDCPAMCCWASVDYRLAPEAQMSDMVDDMVSAYLSLAEPSNAVRFGYSLTRMGLAGMSAGSLLAAHAALRLAELPGPACSAPLPAPSFLLADYPMLDPAMNTESWAVHGAYPPEPWLRQCWQWALAGPKEGAEVSVAKKHEANPVFGHWEAPALKGTRALILLGRCDPMHDEGFALATRLKQAGLQVQLVEAAGAHGIAHWFDKQAAKEFSQGILWLLST